RLDAHRARRTVLCGHRRVQPRRGPARKSSIFECGGEVRGAALARRGRGLYALQRSGEYGVGEALYVGVGVCAYDADLLEKAVFSNVEEKSEVPPSPDAGGTSDFSSTFENTAF